MIEENNSKIRLYDFEDMLLKKVKEGKYNDFSEVLDKVNEYSQKCSPKINNKWRFSTATNEPFQEFSKLKFREAVSFALEGNVNETLKYLKKIRPIYIKNIDYKLKNEFFPNEIENLLNFAYSNANIDDLLKETEKFISKGELEKGLDNYAHILNFVKIKKIKSGVKKISYIKNRITKSFFKELEKGIYEMIKLPITSWILDKENRLEEKVKDLKKTIQLPKKYSKAELTEEGEILENTISPELIPLFNRIDEIHLFLKGVVKGDYKQFEENFKIVKNKIEVVEPEKNNKSLVLHSQKNNITTLIEHNLIEQYYSNIIFSFLRMNEKTSNHSLSKIVTPLN